MGTVGVPLQHRYELPLALLDTRFRCVRLCAATGQVCVAQTRLIVHESRKEELLRRLVSELEQVGFATDPLDVDAERMKKERHRPLGPIVNRSQFRILYDVGAR